MLSTVAPFALADEPAYDPVRWAEAAFDVWQGTHLSAHALARTAARRLDALVGYARAASPFYSRLYRRLPLQGLQLAELPSVDKATVMRHFDDVVTQPDVTRATAEAFAANPQHVGQLLQGRYAVFSSSGTSGTPGCFVHDADALAVYDALESQRGRSARLPGDLLRWMLEGERYALVAATGGHFASVTTVERIRRWLPWIDTRVRTLSLLQPLGQLVAELNAYRPTILATYPTAVDVLAHEQQAGRLRLALAEVWTGGEVLAEPTRARVQDAFGCAVRNAYGASEFLPIAWQCTRGALHVNADWVILEPVDSRGRPVEPGVRSTSVLLTNLANRVQPLIRYNLGDAITVHPGRCPCGSAMPVVTVVGRCDDVLHLPARGGGEVAIVPLALATVLEENAGVHDFQVVQSARGAVSVRLAATERGRTPAVRAALRQCFDELGALTVRIAVSREAPRRERPGGKLRRVVCLHRD
jgi:phenylacetate-CoA ligase